jgi:hypothetical protein
MSHGVEGWTLLGGLTRLLRWPLRTWVPVAGGSGHAVFHFFTIGWNGAVQLVRTAEQFVVTRPQLKSDYPGAAERNRPWIWRYTSERSAANRGLARVDNWSRSGGRSIVRSDCTLVGDLDKTSTRCPR